MEDWEETIFICGQDLEEEGAASFGVVDSSGKVDASGSEAWNQGMEIAGIEEFIGADAQTIRTGIETLDEDLGGGMPLGALVEVAVTSPSAGGQTLILHLLEAARQENRLAALVDGQDSFDPESTPSVLLENLLWARCDDSLQAMKVADSLLRDENIGMVLLDLRWNESRQLQRIKSTDWYRLQRLAERSSACMCVFTSRVMIPSAQARLEMMGGQKLTTPDSSLQERGQELEIRALRLRKAEKTAFPRLIRQATG